MNVAKAAENHGNETIIVHKLAEKYRFKGSWEATGKLVKERIMNNELKYDCCANAMDCYLKLSRDLTKDGNEREMLKLVKYTKRMGMPEFFKILLLLQLKLTLVLGLMI